MNRLRHARRFAAEQEHVVRPVCVVVIRECGARREQDQPTSDAPTPSFERIPVGVAHERHLVEIVHAGAAEGAVGGRKTGRLDDVSLDGEAGGQAQNRAGVLGNVGLVERDPHGLELAQAGLWMTGRKYRGGSDLRELTLLWRGRTCTPPVRVPINAAGCAVPPFQNGLRPACPLPREPAPVVSWVPQRGQAVPGQGRGSDVTTMSTAEPTRRDFLYIATAAVVGVGAAAATWPLIAQMNPDASTIAAGAPIEVDLTPIAEGQVIKVF